MSARMLVLATGALMLIFLDEEGLETSVHTALEPFDFLVEEESCVKLQPIN